MWRIMLDAEVIKRNSIYFDTKLSLGEDTKFINRYFLHEQSVGYLDECLYHLTFRATGANNTSNSNLPLMMENKLKLINARLELDNVALQQGLELHKFWEGTMVLSAVQLLIGFATSEKFGWREGYKLYKKYESNGFGQEAIDSYSPVFGVKAIPFLLIKHGLAFVLYLLLRIVPMKLINRMIQETI